MLKYLSEVIKRIAITTNLASKFLVNIGNIVDFIGQ